MTLTSVASAFRNICGEGRRIVANGHVDEVKIYEPRDGARVSPTFWSPDLGFRVLAVR